MRKPLVIAALTAAVLLGGCSAPATTAPAASHAPAVAGVRKVTPEQARDLLAQGYQAVDVRTAAELAGGKVKGAQNVDALAPDFESKVKALPRDGRYVVYCRSGSRSAKAAETMKKLGFTDVADAGGFDALKAAGAPTE